MEHYTSIRFHHFKGFRQYAVSLRNFNVLVGPNNCGKSTIIGAFRILAEAMRKANARNPELVMGPNGEAYGYSIDLSEVPVATENVFYDYKDDQPATVTFRLSNGNELLLFFPQVGVCNLIATSTTSGVRSTAAFRREFNAPIGFVPILGPVEHNEQFYQKEAARLALLTHRAARNFRNIWYHYPEEFENFRDLVRSTWPGMDIEMPQVDQTHRPPRLHMFCPEERIPREIFWAGFGFQVWCQMLTYLIRGSRASLFLIDEPDIYLHSDLQRQLLGILRSLGPDILIATHSTEIITEADPEDLLVINKHTGAAKRIREPGELQHVFQVLGSNLNPVLTQLAKTRRAVFVEGKDFQIFARFARKIHKMSVANRGDFAVIPVDGFNPRKVKDFIGGIEITLGGKIASAVVFDRDYRSDAECAEIGRQLSEFSSFAVIHGRKEIENFLLDPNAITKAISSRLKEQAQRTGTKKEFNDDALELLERLTDPMRNKVLARYLERRKPFEKSTNKGISDETITERLMEEYDGQWSDIKRRLLMVPGKDTLASLNKYLQDNFSITISPTLIIESFSLEEVPVEMLNLIKKLDEFCKEQLPITS